MQLGPDGRPAVLCLANAHTDAIAAPPNPSSPGLRYQQRPIPTLRIVSLPADGRLAGIGTAVEQVFGEPASEPIQVLRAIAGPRRFAVLGLAGPNRRPHLWVFRAQPPVSGVSAWTTEISRNLERTIPPALLVAGVALGWSAQPPAVFLVVHVPVTRGSNRRPPARAPGRLDVWLLTAPNLLPSSPFPVLLPAGDAGLPQGLDIDVRARDVVAINNDAVRVALTFEASNRATGAIVETRAAVLGLSVGTPTFPNQHSFLLDSSFAAGGCWLAPDQTVAGGPLSTTAHRLSVDRQRRLVVSGRALDGANRSLYVAWLNPSGSEIRSVFPCQRVVTDPVDPIIDASNRVVIGGSSGVVDDTRSDDPTETILERLEARGTSDGSFGINGVTTLRLHGGTHLGALLSNPNGTLLASSFVRWGLKASAIGNHLCVNRLTSSGTVDPTFGSVGTARHDGLGSAEFNLVNFFSSSQLSSTVAPDGTIWSAGVAPDYALPRPNVTGQLPFVELLTCVRLTARGELDPAFGLRGIATYDLSADLQARSTTPGAPPSPLPRFTVDSIVLLAGGVLIAGSWQSFTGTTPSVAQGWLVRLDASGQFVRAETWPVGQSMPIVLFGRQLASGHVQGIENGSIVRFDPGVTTGDSRVAGFRSGDRPLAPFAALPNGIRADGSFIGLVSGPYLPNLTSGTSGSVGLVRIRPDGTIDPAFGTGGTAGGAAAAADVIALGQVRTPNLAPLLAPELHVHDSVFATSDGRLSRVDTLELPDGTLLSVAAVRPDNTQEPEEILLLRWSAAGKPLAVPQWGNFAGRAIPNVLGPLQLASVNPMSCRPTGAALLGDGSVAVALEATDFRQGRAQPTAVRASLPRIAGFCRLVPPNFMPDTAMNGGGVEVFVAGRDPRVRVGQPLPTNVEGFLELQTPTGIRALPDGSVVCAIRLLSIIDPRTVGGFFIQMSPDRQWFDGSIAAVRFI